LNYIRICDFFYDDENNENDRISILNSKQEAIKLSQDLFYSRINVMLHLDIDLGKCFCEIFTRKIIYFLYGQETNVSV